MTEPNRSRRSLESCEWQGGAAPESRVADQCVAVLVGHPLSVDFLSGISMGRIRDRPLPQSPGRILLW
ncbi:hypothetical protein ACKI1O_52880, partial [Streptomyces scabiei]